jgi:prolyl oligopeptidase
MEITNKLAVYTLKGKYRGDVKLPKIIGRGVPVTLSQAVGKRAKNTAYFTMTSFVLPSLVCSFDIKSLEAKVWATPEVKFDPTAYEVEYTHYKSKDGTSIPISIIYKKGLKRNGKTPTLLYGYGGFNISILPKFALDRLPLLEAGGVYAVANIRGGGELGKSWHKAGTQLQKQNVFDDFIAAAEYLIKEKYTSSAKLAIEGRSNGGLLVGACMTQRPDLYRVAFPIVGVLDMLRYHKFTIGHFWATDYGTSDQKEHFENLIKYSPVHNVRAVNYPATMVMTADHDDRVVPGHSFKFAAELQTKQTSSAPILLRVDRKAGHGAGKPTSMRIDEIADKIAFLLFNTQD